MLSRQIGCDWLKSCAPGSFLSGRRTLSLSLWVDWSIAILTSLSAFGNFLGDIYKGAQVKPPATSTLVLGRCVKFVISLSAPASGCLGGCRAVSSFAPKTYFNVGQRRREMWPYRSGKSSTCAPGPAASGQFSLSLSLVRSQWSIRLCGCVAWNRCMRSGLGKFLWSPCARTSKRCASLWDTFSREANKFV